MANFEFFQLNSGLKCKINICNLKTTMKTIKTGSKWIQFNIFDVQKNKQLISKSKKIN